MDVDIYFTLISKGSLYRGFMPETEFYEDFYRVWGCPQ
jgi:hypothetical protein